MRRLWWAVLPVGAVMFMLSAGLVMVGGTVLFTAPATAATCRPSGGVATDPVGSWDQEQTANAATIVAVGRQRGIPQRGLVIALATAMQESTLRNLDGGDRDSAGLFQQRPSQGWGTFEQVTDPLYAANKFYDGLMAVAGWEAMPLYVAAQTVQKSGFPFEYQKWEDDAETLLAGVGGAPVIGAACQAAAVVTGQWALPLATHLVPDKTAEHHTYPAVDFALGYGGTESVFAITGGTVTLMQEPLGCGDGVYVRTGDDAWLYCHFSQRLVTSGQRVEAGELIGVSGWSGHVDPPGPAGAHLHVQLTRGGSRVCLNKLIDNIKAGLEPPATLTAAYPCIPNGG